MYVRANGRSNVCSIVSILGLCLYLLGACAWADEHGTADEAVALVKKVIVYYKANGPDKTWAEINRRDHSMFTSKDLYVFVGGVGPNTPTPAHGANPKLVGKVMTDLKDVDDVPFTRMMHEIANSKEGKGWVDYKWPNPVTKQIEKKSTYVERLDDKYYVACGIYKQ